MFHFFFIKKMSFCDFVALWLSLDLLSAICHYYKVKTTIVPIILSVIWLFWHKFVINPHLKLVWKRQYLILIYLHYQSVVALLCLSFCDYPLLDVEPVPGGSKCRHFLPSSTSSVSFSCRSRSRLISFSSCLYFRSMKRFWWAICGKLSGEGKGQSGKRRSQPTRTDKEEEHVMRRGQFPTGRGWQFRPQIAAMIAFKAGVVLLPWSNEVKCCD